MRRDRSSNERKYCRLRKSRLAARRLHRCRNTAIDVRHRARRLGAEAVHLIYRRSEKEMTAFPYEHELAKKTRAFSWQTQPVRALGSGRRGDRPDVCRTHMGAPDARGRRHAGTYPKAISRLKSIWIVGAVGQKPVTDFLRPVKGIELRKNGTVAVDAHHQTGNPKYFAGGDCVNGGGKSSTRSRKA